MDTIHAPPANGNVNGKINGSPIGFGALGSDFLADPRHNPANYSVVETDAGDLTAVSAVPGDLARNRPALEKLVEIERKGYEGWMRECAAKLAHWEAVLVQKQAEIDAAIESNSEYLAGKAQTLVERERELQQQADRLARREERLTAVEQGKTGPGLFLYAYRLAMQAGPGGSAESPHEACATSATVPILKSASGTASAHHNRRNFTS